MENNWEYSIDGGILTLRINLLGPAVGLTSSKSGTRVRVANTGNMTPVINGIDPGCNMVLTMTLSREGTAEELTRLHAARRACLVAAGRVSPSSPEETY